jgi:hypothetical protein
VRTPRAGQEANMSRDTRRKATRVTHRRERPERRAGSVGFGRDRRRSARLAHESAPAAGVSETTLFALLAPDPSTLPEPGAPAYRLRYACSLEESRPVS